MSATKPNWQERREVQFLLERACADSGERHAQAIEQLQPPIPIWVYWPPRTQQCTCGAPRSFEVCESAKRLARDRIAYEPNEAPGGYVCEHMGRLIE